MNTSTNIPISKIIISIWNKYKELPRDESDPSELDELIAMVADISENTIKDMLGNQND